MASKKYQKLNFLRTVEDDHQTIFTESFISKDSASYIQKLPESEEESKKHSLFDKNFEEFSNSYFNINENSLEKKDKHKNFFKFFLLFTWQYSKRFLPVAVIYCISITINIINILIVNLKEDKEDLGNKRALLSYSINFGLSLYYMLSISIAIGINSTLDSMCSNAFGAKMYNLLGWYLNRALIILTLLFIPICIIVLFMTKILLCFGQDPVIAEHTGLFLKGLLPGMLFFMYTDACRRFMHSQGVIAPTIYLVLFTSLLHPFIAYFFYIYLEWGCFGNGLAITFTNLINLILILLIIKKFHFKDTLALLSGDSLIGMRDFFSNAFPSLLMVCLETWNYQIINFIVSFIHNIFQEKANSVLINFSTIIYMFPFAFSIVASNIIGKLVGDYSFRKTQIASKMIIIISIIFSLMVLISLLFLRTLLPQIYLKNDEGSEETKDYMDSLFLFFMFFEFFECLTTSLSGIFSGLGLQKIIAITNFICFYIICIPLTCILIFQCKLKIYGAWISYCITITILTTMYGIIYYKKVNYYKICKDTNKKLSSDRNKIALCSIIKTKIETLSNN
jgi:MATE family multidrug resistance protein